MDALNIFRNYLNTLVTLEPLEWEMLCSFLSVEYYKEKDLLDIEGGDAGNLYFLLDGAVRVFRNVNGKECTYNLYSTPRFIANIRSLINNSLAMHSIQVLAKSTIIVLRFKDAKKLYDILPKYDRIGRILTEMVLLQEVERIDNLTCYEPYERFQRLMADNSQLMTLVPQKYIASYLGISPESLSRMKNKFAAEKVF